jgi:RNA polymerase sigma factor for flagellar operon FliA
VLEREAVERGDLVTRRLAGALAALAPQDGLILKLRFDDGFTVGQIARVLRLEEKPLYRRLERILGGLRERLESEGVAAAEVAELLGSPAWEPPALLGAAAKPPGAAV